MSEMEAHKGKLVPMVLSGVTLEDRCSSACSLLGFITIPDNTTWEEYLRDVGYKKVFIRDEVIYEVQDTALDASGFAEAVVNDNGTIDYMLMYYNGGGSFDEVLDGAIDNKVTTDD